MSTREELLQEARQKRAEERKRVRSTDPTTMLLCQIAEILELISSELSGINNQLGSRPPFR